MKARRYKHTVNGGCMKAVLFFCAVLFAHGARAQIELKSGLIVSGGESMYYDVIPRVSPEGDVPVLYGDRKFDVAAGYKFRLQPAGKRFFADLDIQAGYGQVRYENHYTSFEDMNPLLDRGKDNYLRLSLNPTFNCKVYDGWYAGLGVEPTVCMVYKASSDTFSAFDIPLTARIGYDFKYMDLSFNYKYGFCDVMDADYFTGGKVRRWQLQLFIPF